MRPELLVIAGRPLSVADYHCLHRTCTSYANPLARLPSSYCRAPEIQMSCSTIQLASALSVASLPM